MTTTKTTAKLTETSTATETALTLRLGPRLLRVTLTYSPVRGPVRILERLCVSSQQAQPVPLGRREGQERQQRVEEVGLRGGPPPQVHVR